MRGKQAANGLRLIAACELLLSAKLVLFGYFRRRAFASLERGDVDHREVFIQLEHYAKLSLWAHVGFCLAILLGAVVMTTALRRGRALAIGSIAAMLLHLGLLAASYGAAPHSEIPLWLKMLWSFSDLFFSSALALPLVAASRARPGDLTRVGAIGAIALTSLAVACTWYQIHAAKLTPSSEWVTWSLDCACSIWFAAFAFVTGTRLASATEDDAEGTGTLNGAPLRMLGWTMLARILVGLSLPVTLIFSLAKNELDIASTLTTMATVANALVSLVMLFALIAYFRYPASHRSDALIVTMAMVVVSMALDIVAANAASELFRALGDAKRAASMWGMPSMSKMEELQSTLNLAARASLVAGIVAGCSLAVSLGKTAHAIRDEGFVAKAHRVIVLMIVIGLGALLIGLMAAGLAKEGGVFLILLALGLLVTAIVLVVEWLALLFGLAGAVQSPAPESEQ